MIEQLNLDTMDIEKFCVTYNAANMVKAIRESRYLERYPCDIHTLNLCVDNTFVQTDGMNNVNKKSKALAKLTHQSTSVANEQLKAQVLGSNTRSWRIPMTPDGTASTPTWSPSST